MAIVFDSDAGTITGLSVGGLPDGIVDAGTLADNAVTAAKIAANSVDSSELVDGSIDNSHLAADAVDFVTIRNDISTLALHSAIADNKAAYNLPNSFIDQFEDDTGIGTETDGDRNASEYWGTAGTAVGNDGDTLFLLEPDATNCATTFTDLSAAGVTITGGGGITHSTTQNKFGATSIYFAGDDYLTIPTRDAFDWGTGGAFTVDAWVYCTSWNGFGQGDGKLWDGATKHRFGFKGNGATMGGEGFGSNWTTHSMNNDTWYHIAWVRHTDGSARMYVGGSQLHAQTGNTENFNATNGSIICIGDATALSGGEDVKNLYLGGIRVSNVDRTKDSNDPMYIATGTSYTVPTHYYGTAPINATGTLISTAQTANAAQTKVSGVILYKNNEGTATLGTDLKVYFTCNGGTNWTESTPAAAGTFSTGILMAKCPEVTCTSGTDVRYKVEWANQLAGSKETQLHGIAINY